MTDKTSTRSFPECWGHRGASAAYPENTLASFEAAIRDGAEGIESDVHVSLDNVVVMFHDPSLERTTDGKGLIRERMWYGPEGMEGVRTVKEPRQSIPTFAETVELLMRPDNRHVKFNVDVKVYNDPTKLFSLVQNTIESYDNWETLLAPRILLGLWHPRFIGPAKTLLPYCRRSYIGMRPSIARKYFWDGCQAFSMWFPSLCSAEGQRFMAECKAAGKSVMVWTVNDPAMIMEAVRWGVDAILTDTTKTWLGMRSELSADYERVNAQHTRTFMWTTLEFYTPVRFALSSASLRKLEQVAGSFDEVTVEDGVPAALPATVTVV